VGEYENWRSPIPSPVKTRCGVALDKAGSYGWELEPCVSSLPAVVCEF